MQKVFSTAACTILAVLVFSGCASPGARETGLAQTAPKMTRISDRGYYAACGYETPGGHLGPWTGPLRSSKGDALADASNHDKDFAGHQAQVVHY